MSASKKQSRHVGPCYSMRSFQFDAAVLITAAACHQTGDGAPEPLAVLKNTSVTPQTATVPPWM